MEEFVEREYSQSERFQRDAVTPTANTVYLRVQGDQVKGLLSKKYAVPQGFVGLIKDKKGAKKVLMPGEEASGDFTAHLVRDRDIRIPFHNQPVLTKDGFEAEASFELSVLPDVTRKDALENFIERSAGKHRHLDWTLLKAELQTRINEALKKTIKDFTVEELADGTAMKQVRERALERCGADLAAHGISFADLEVSRIRSEAHEKHKLESAERERGIERASAEQEVQAAILRDQMGQELSRKELEEFLSNAREEGLIKEHRRKLAEVERQAELDHFEAEYREQKHSLEAALRKMLTEEQLELDAMMLDRYVDVVKDLKEELSDDRIEVYINLLKDERLKADLLHRLIQRSMTPEQLTAIAEIEAQRVRQAELSISRPRLEPIREEQAATDKVKESDSVRVSESEPTVKREAEIDDEDIAQSAAESMNVALGTALSEAVTKATYPTERTPTEEMEEQATEELDRDETIEVPLQTEAEADADTEVSALVLVASGRHVYAIDPLSQTSLSGLPLDLNYDSGRMGSLRSVRVCGEGADRLVLAGARNGIYTTLIQHQKGHREYPIGQGVDARTGINAAVTHRGFIYATHSEFGLLRWPLLQPYSNAVQVMPELISKYSTTRNLQIFDGRLLFANGPTVLLLEATSETGGTLKVAARYRGTRHEVTALAADDRYVLVADTAGDVFVWDPKSEEEPVLAFYAGASISDLAAAELKGERRCLLVAIKRPTVPMLFRDGSNALEFVAPEPVRSCDVLNGTVIGLSRDRMRVFAWREHRPDWPAWQFQFTEPVLDLRLVPPGQVTRDSGRHEQQPGIKKPPGYGAG